MMPKTLSLIFSVALLAAVAADAVAGRWNLWNDPVENLTRPEPVKVAPKVDAKAVEKSAPKADGKAPPVAAKTSGPAPIPESAPPAVAGDGYVIGVGDVLDISVWKDEALMKSAVVLPDGMIAFPLIGQVEAAGKTVSQLKSEMESRLSRYVSDLVLSVEVKQLNSMTIYVIGRVNAPGRFALNGNISVLQALAMAGGFNPFAGRDKIKIFRQDGEKTEVLPFRYSDVAESRNLEQNIRLRRGDVIVVP